MIETMMNQEEKNLYLANEANFFFLNQTYLTSIDSDDMGHKICTNITCIQLSCTLTNLKLNIKTKQ